MKIPGLKRSSARLRIVCVVWLGFFLASCASFEREGVSRNSQDLSSLLSACRPALAEPSPEFIYHPEFKQLPGNRFLLSFYQDLSDEPQWQAWVHRLLTLASEGASGVAGFETASSGLVHSECREALLGAETFQHRTQLFSNWQHTLYRPWPIIADLMKPFVNLGVQRELAIQSEIEKKYRAIGHPLDLGLLTNRQWYGSRKQTSDQFGVEEVRRDALGIPLFSHQQSEALLDHWQPLWAIQEKADNDRPLALQRRHGELQTVNEPSIYRYISFARLGDEPILQLNYVMWFSERKPDGPFDILAGKLDGIHFRTYLDRRGTLLAHDAMHNCGCWYQLYPSPRLRQLKPASGEPSFNSRFWSGDKPPIVLISANRHRIEAVLPHRDDAWRRHGEPLQLLQKKSYSELREVFYPSGLIPESKRPERFLFAPLGVPAAGSMRSRGRHQIAFTSERYFDDPRLLESLGYRRIESGIRLPASD
ncbi:hypothetical protein [Pseudoteredinibacter isoporae]|uniref:Uncharacterized protein n=1 Tax=Pseudoteredinibacter isoporae TaxID=570281 RepID=A0A7X0MWH2_9GAMM|nr:hypothetical protein [Pseudoteredinibacter isoporae]MBB6522483.1 hypothetical protein [Pseudoteredinibacter isoporae]NHO88013.1 hypothetical protein [Pseudoteredinibacter isoporae]NIB23656.1 hypothetical protein [Pseudoteredinibacter isoporae]